VDAVQSGASVDYSGYSWTTFTQHVTTICPYDYCGGGIFVKHFQVWSKALFYENMFEALGSKAFRDEVELMGYWPLDNPDYGHRIYEAKNHFMHDLDVFSPWQDIRLTFANAYI